MMAKEKRKGLIRMRKVIDGRVYDTETAKQIAGGFYSNYGVFQYWCEELYHTNQFQSPISGVNDWNTAEQIGSDSYSN